MTLPRETGALKSTHTCDACGSSQMATTGQRGETAICAKCNDARLDVQKASEGTVPRTLGS